MSRVSINGQLKPKPNRTIIDEYVGHFLKVSYIQEINGNSVYSKDRFDVEKDGIFRLFLPEQDLLTGSSVNLEVFAPDGSLLTKQIKSLNSLFPAEIPPTNEDQTVPFIVYVNPQVNEFIQPGPVQAAFRKISGKVVDTSGEKNGANIQVILFATTVSSPDSEDFQAVFSAKTNKDGYFYGKVNNHEYEEVYGLIAGLTNHVGIQLIDKKIPKDLLLTLDLSGLAQEEVCACKGEAVPSLPDASELVGNTAFSQDIGGKCVDFTTPNRTLEEFSFYHTVRTTEPEIRGLTITSQESKRLKMELQTISDDLFTVFGRINNSMDTLSMAAYAVDEEAYEPIEDNAKEMTSEDGDLSGLENKASVRALESTPYATSPVYRLKLLTGASQLKFSSKDLKLDFSAMLKLVTAQAKRKARLQQLHYELASAYCGKKGAAQAKTYCETLVGKDTLNRATIDALLGHIDQYIQNSDEDFFLNSTLKVELATYVEALKNLVKQPFVDISGISLVNNRAQKLIKAIDTQTRESQDQEELLGYMRRIINELSQAGEEGLYNFEPCPQKTKTQSMGVLCMLQQFEETRDILRNKSVLSLGEILTIRGNYDTYVMSIGSFLQLLEKFHSFYTSSSGFLITLEDDYFVKNYDSIRGMLNVLKRKIYLAIRHIEAIESAYIRNHPGRKELSVENGVDWDETPTIYENTTIAHGHILHFKQQWKADGYSLGDLLYSLPLAPCQEKQIAIVDWDREERSARSESDVVADSLAATVGHDRDISEIMNSSFSENISASSYNKTSGTSAGIGGGIFGAIGGLFGGVSHSGASSKSTANQNSARNLSGSTMNRLQDNVSQSASSLRTRRSTVIQTVGQNETVSVQTEVVKNNNHCHAVTIEYFEVLRHYAVVQELVDVQECLFVPLPMSLFDYSKIMRWDYTLRRSIYGSQLQRGFAAIKRLTNNYADSDFPVNSYADEMIQDFSGHFTISFDLTRPYMSTIDDLTKTETYDLHVPFPWFFGSMKFTLEREVPLTEAEKDAVFEKEYVPDIVRTFIEKLEVFGIGEDGSEEKLDLDVTLLSNYRRGAPLKVSIASRTIPTVTRRQIRHLRFRADTSVKASSKILLRSVYLNYRTKHLSEAIIRNGRVNNDIINVTEVEVNPFVPPFIEVKTVTDAALMYTPLNAQELRNPRKEDQEAAEALLAYLNEHLELAHKAIWSSMDASRLFGLLDGYIAPNSGNRSVASVVENKIMGIVGNNLVLKVVPGERLDPVFRSVEDLVTYYQPTTKPDPFRVSVPTKGVYAESVLGQCNSCEEIDESRHWRFDQAPCGSQPASIEAVSTASRRSDVGDLQSKDMPSSIISMQNAPAAPDPTGLGAAFDLLGKSDAFKDMTGLAGTQANAIKALETTSNSVTALAGMASDLKKQEAMKKDIGKTLKNINDAKANKQISEDQANKLAYTALSSMVGEPTTKATKLTQEKDIQNLIKAQTKKPASSIKINSGTESVEISQPVSESKEASVESNTESTAIFSPGTNPGSSKTEAHALVTAFQSRSGDLKFNVTRSAVAANLTELIDDPNKVSQGQLNLCGPAATVRAILRRDPKSIAKCVIQLVEIGQGIFGKRTLKPVSDLRNQTYQSSWGSGAAEWVLMSSMRDDENWWFDFEGTPNEDVSGATTPGEIEEWLTESGLFSKVEDEANLFITAGIDHALGLNVNNRTENILLIHAHLLRLASATDKKSDEFILNSFPNHWVVLDSVVTRTSGRVVLNVWSWGSIYTIDVPEETFEANYYGAVIAQN